MHIISHHCLKCIPDLVVAEVNSVELVEGGAKALDDRDLVSAEVQLPVPHGVDVLPSALDQIRSTLNHFLLKHV